MDQSSLRFGVVGAGYMTKMHMLAIHNLEGLAWPDAPHLEKVRIADIAPGAAEAAAKRWGFAEHTADWREITRADDIDIVVIVTPNKLHPEIAIDAFRHGKHVLCEKPMAATLPEAREMVRAQETSGKCGMVFFSYRNWPAIQEARRLIDEGRLGDIVFVDGTFFLDSLNTPDFAYAWRHNKVQAGSGALGDLGSHIIDILCHLAGPIDQVTAKMALQYPTRPGPDGKPKAVDVDDLTVMMAQFKNGASGGALGSIKAGWAMEGHKQNISFSIVGTKGAIEFDWRNLSELKFYEDTGEATTQGFRTILVGPMHPQAEIFWNAAGQGMAYWESVIITYRRFINAITSGAEATPSFQEALHIAAICDAAVEAADKGTWVSVPKN